MYRLYLLITVLFLSLGVSFAGSKKQTIPIHEDWFSVKYDDVREATVIKTKDPYGPGGSSKYGDGDNVKMSITASFSGDAVDETTPMAITIAFSRLAGLNVEHGLGKGGLFYQSAAGDAKFRPTKKFLYYLKDCKEVIFLTPTGEKTQMKESAVSYKTSMSDDMIGNGYLWETLLIKCDMNFLKKLQDGAKGALCEGNFILCKDAISQIRSFLSIVGQLDEEEEE